MAIGQSNREDRRRCICHKINEGQLKGSVICA